MNHLAISTPVASTLPEQAITASLTVEIMTDLDNGQPNLVAYSDSNQGDLREVTPAQVMAEVVKLRADADRIEQLAREYAAAHVIPAFVEHFSITLRETSLDELRAIDPEVAAIYMGHGLRLPSGELLFVVPEGQDPLDRLAFIRSAISGMDKQAAAA